MKNNDPWVQIPLFFLSLAVKIGVTIGIPALVMYLVIPYAFSEGFMERVWGGSPGFLQCSAMLVLWVIILAPSLTVSRMAAEKEEKDLPQGQSSGTFPPSDQDLN